LKTILSFLGTVFSCREVLSADEIFREENKVIEIGPAVERELENIYSLIRGDSGLQQDMLPSCDEFIVVRIDREVNCCCALKEYSRKLAEIRSFAFLNPELKRLYGEILVGECIKRARRRKIYQLLVTLSRNEQGLFEPLGFRPVSNSHKYAMLKPIQDLRPLEILPIPGVRLVNARTDFHWAGIKELARLFPDDLIQPEHELFPSRRQFCAAIADNQVAGMAALTVFRRRNKPPERGEIRTVAVRPSFRGRRIGPKLVASCVNRAIMLGLPELFTVTRKKAWFEDQGFSNVRGSEEAWFMELGQAA